METETFLRICEGSGRAAKVYKAASEKSYLVSEKADGLGDTKMAQQFAELGHQLEQTAERLEKAFITASVIASGAYNA